jgi:IclR family acetate operon transcriptional repressor
VADDNRYTVRSVSRSIEILELLRDAGSEGLSLTEASAACGLSKSSTYAVLYTLLRAGFVADSGRTGQNRRYRLGLALTRLGDAARDQLAVHGVALPVMQSLAANLNISVRCGLLMGRQIGIVDQVNAPTGLSIDLRMGELELLHCTAIGKAILAGRPDDEIIDLLGPEPLTRRTARTITTQSEFLEHLAAVRRQRYAIDDEEDHDGIICIGAPIFDGGGNSVAAISVTTLKAGLDAERLDSIIAQVIGAADRASRHMGWSTTVSTHGPGTSTADSPRT